MPEFFDCASAENFRRIMRDTETFFGIPQDSNEAFAKFEQMVNEKCGCPEKPEGILPMLIRKQAW